MKRAFAMFSGAIFAALALAVAAAPSALFWNHPEAPAELKQKLSK
jgi:hypothetical protein